MTIEEWLDEDNKLGIDIWHKKYQKNNETFDEWVDRVSNGIEEVKQLIYKKKFLPGGRILSNIGINDTKSAMSNCHSRGFIEDDFDDIMKAAVDIAKTYKRQGGQGLSLTKLRPKGSPIGEHYTSDGIVPFMKIYNEVTDGVQNGGSRKGALLMSLDAWHKEALDFITIKSKEGMIEKANLSLEIDNEFMDCVDKYYETGEVKTIHRKENYSGHIVEWEVTPIEVFKAFIHNNWEWGDPGCLFVDKFRHYNLMEPVDGYKIMTANPSLRKGTLVKTSDGYVPIEQLEGELFEVVTINDKYVPAKCFLSGKNKQLYKITLENNEEIYCTPEHKWPVYVEKGIYKKKETSDLTTEDRFILNPIQNMFVEYDNTIAIKNIQLTNIYEDVWDIHVYDNTHTFQIEQCITGNCGEQPLPKHGTCLTYDTLVTTNKGVRKIGDIVNSSNGFVLSTDNKYRVYNKVVNQGYKDVYKIILTNGLEIEATLDHKFDTEDGLKELGQLTPDDRIKLATILPLDNNDDDSSYFENINYLNYGREYIRSYHTELPKDFYNWELKNQMAFVLGLKKDNNTIVVVNENFAIEIQKFLASVSCYSTLYSVNFISTREKKPVEYKLVIDTEIFDSCQVANIVKVGTKEVFDILDVSETNMFYANGMAVHNCNLASINLSEFVENPYTPHARFNYPAFYDAVGVGIRYLDSIIDINAERVALPEQKEMALKYRNCGLGVFGYASMLIKLGLKYGENDAIFETDKIFHGLFMQSLYASVRLGEKYGSFPGYDSSIWDSEFIRKNLTEQQIETFKKVDKLRNCSLISIAPTGSIATMLGESGGCEPEFAISYQRRTVGMTDNKDKYYTVYCKTAKEYLKLHPESDGKLPDYFISSTEIDPIKRVETQATMQYHVDTAISSTVNVPESCTEEEMAHIYLEGWRRGLKGLTIFRSNCKRVAILTTNDNKNTNTNKEVNKEANKEANNQTNKQTELKRGDIIDCSFDLVGKKRKLYVGCGSLHILAFFDPTTGDMLEVYLNKGSTGGCANFTTGLSRMISLSLRAGVDVYTIKDQLDSTGVCPSYAVRTATKHDTSKGACCPMAVGNALVEMYEEMRHEMDDSWEISSDMVKPQKPVLAPKTLMKSQETEPSKRSSLPISASACPECGAEMQFTGGCQQCSSCGYSKCD